MSGIPFNDWCDEEYFYEEMAKMHKINPKLDIIQVLFDQFQKIQSDKSYRPLKLDITEAERNWLLVELSAQIVALSMELTDDLAFVCEGYLKALRDGDKKVVTNIAGLQRSDAEAFYQRVSQSAEEATLALGLDPSNASQQDKESNRKVFAGIRKNREQFWKFYNAYKHGQYATPIVVGNNGGQRWGLYRIPDRPKIRDGKLHTEGEERFIDTVTFAGEFVELGKLAWQLRRLGDAGELQNGVSLRGNFDDAKGCAPKCELALRL